MDSPLQSLILTFTLALAMAAGALAHGVALATPPRGQVALQQIVICAAGDGEILITIDASGNRVDPAREECPRQPCPDCLNTTAFALPPALPAPAWAPTGCCVVQAVAGRIHRASPYTRPAARGPPQKV